MCLRLKLLISGGAKSANTAATKHTVVGCFASARDSRTTQQSAPTAKTTLF
jgi:hypothetical protein